MRSGPYHRKEAKFHKICAMCRKPFDAIRDIATYCSDTCRYKARYRVGCGPATPDVNPTQHPRDHREIHKILGGWR